MSNNRFEELPDEILLEIFKYVDPMDLHSFFGHNQRMNNVIRDVKVSVVIRHPVHEDRDRDYLAILLAKQGIRLDLRDRWDALNIHRLKELRSLTIDCHCLSECQFDELFSVHLPYLERFSIGNVPHPAVKEFFRVLINNEHFPSLKFCQFSGNFYFLLDIDENDQPSNNTIRTLILNKLIGSELGLLLKLLPNLRRLETNLVKLPIGSLDLNVPYTSLENLSLTLADPLNDLKIILPYTPLLKRLRITGKIVADTVLLHFEALAKFLRSQATNLQQFDCELYFHAWAIQVDILILQQLHPLFNKIQCHRGSSINRCYATDLTEYPHQSEYSYIARRRDYVSDYWELTDEDDSDHYTDEYYTSDPDDDNGDHD